MAETMTYQGIPNNPGPAEVMRPVPRITIEAFCDGQETGRVVQHASTDRRLSKAHLLVYMGGIGAAIARYTETATPNLIMVESHFQGAELFAQLAGLAQVCDAGTKIIVIGHTNDVHTYREMMRQGVDEYLMAPLQELQVVESVSRLYVDPSAPPIGRSIVFVGSRGGAGSSTIAHNTGWNISQGLHQDVTLLDMDLSFGTLGLNFNKESAQGIADALVQPDRLDDVLLDRLLVKCTDRLSLFTAPGTLERDAEITDEASDSVIESVRATCPVVIIDLPHIWSPWSKRILTNADSIVIVATPDLASLRNTRNLVDLLKYTRSNDELPYLVLNQVGIPKKPEIPLRDFCETVELKATLSLPFEPHLFGAAANNGQMIDMVEPRGKIAAGIRQLAAVVTGRQEAPPPSRSVLPFLKKLKS